MVHFGAGGVKASMPNHVLTAGWCVPQYTSNELIGAQPRGLGSMVAMVGVAKAHRLAVLFERAVCR